MFSLFNRNLVEFIKKNVSKGIFIFAAMIFAGMGNVWGDEYTLRNDSNGQNWNGTDTWRDKSSGDWGNTANHPGEDDTAYIDQAVTIYVTESIRIGTVQGNKNTTLVIQSGVTFTVDNLLIGDNSTKTITINVLNGGKLILNNANKDTGNLKITGTGSLEVAAPDILSELSTDQTNPGTWTGLIDNDWSNPFNWSGITDTSQLDSLSTVTIPAGCTNYPSATGINLTGELVIGTGATLEINGTSSIGKISADSTSTITTGASITLSQPSTIGNLTLKNSTTTLNTSDDITIAGDIEGLGANSSLDANCNNFYINGSIGQNSTIKDISVTGHFEGAGGSEHPIKISGNLTIDGYDACLRGDIEAGSIEIKQPCSILGATNAIRTTGTQSYKGFKINSDSGLLTLTGTTVTLDGNITPHETATTSKSLKVSGNTVLKGTITTTGTQTYTGAVALSGDTTILTNSSSVTFGNTITGGTHDITIGSATDSTESTFNGNVTAVSTLNLYGNSTLGANINVAVWNNPNDKTITPGTSTVTVSSKVNGSNTFNNLTISSTTGSVQFEAGKTQTVNGTFTAAGSSGSEVSLLSSITGNQWNLDARTATISYAKIKDANNISGTPIAPSNSINLGNNTGFDLPSKFRWSATAASSDVTTLSNWELNTEGTTWITATSLPGQNSTDDEIEIQDSTNNPLFASATDIICKKLTIDSGAELTLSNAGNIQVKEGSFTNEGTVIYTSSGRIKNNAATPAAIMDAVNGTVEFTTTASTIDNISTANDYNNLILSGTLTLLDDIKTNGTLLLRDDVTIFGSGKTLTIGSTTDSIDSTARSLTLGATGEPVHFEFKNIGSNNKLNNITAFGTFTANPGSISITGALDCKSSAIFRGNINAASVNVDETLIFGHATRKVTTTSALGQTYNGPVQINTDTSDHDNTLTLLASTNTVNFNSTIDKYTTGSPVPELIIGDASNLTNVKFNGNISQLTSLTVKGTTEFTANVSSVSTTSNQTYNDNVTFARNFEMQTTADGATISIAKNLSGGTNSFTLSGGTLNFATTNGVSHDFTAGDTTITAGEFNFGTGNFTAAKLTVDTGAKFTQTGANPEANTQTVAYLDNRGSMIWDSSEAGGTLTVTGTGNDVIKSSDINHLIVFNKKNVTIDTAYISGIFYDLTIPAGKTFTNNLAIAVRRNLTINGTYADNSKTLYLGQFTSGGTPYASVTGTISGSTTANPVNLGAVTINQQTTSKTFYLPLSITTLTCQDATATAGDLNFTKNITVANAATGVTKLSTNCNYIFGSASSSVTVDFQKGVSFSQPREVSLNGTLQASVSGGIDIDGPLTLTGDTTIKTTAAGAAGKIKLSAVTDTTSEFNISPAAGSIELHNTVSVAKLTIANPSSILIENQITATNGFTLTGSGSGTIKNKIITTNSDILFNSAAASTGVITLNGNTAFETGTGFGNVILNQPFSSDGAHTFEISTGTGDILIESSIGTATQALGAITLKGNTFISNTSVVNSGTANITVGTDAAPKDLYISARNGTTAQAVTFKAGTLDVKGNIALFNGNVTLNANMTAGKDIILLKGHVNSMYKDSQSNITNLFDYHNSLRTADNKLCPPSLVYTAPGSATPTASKYPERFPDSATHTITHTGDNTYISSLTGFAGKTITANQNFYDNGVTLEPTGAWNLKIKTNDDATNSFAEAYNARIKYCNVSCTTANGFAWLSAGEGCTNSGNNNDDSISSPAPIVYDVTSTTGAFTRTQTGVAFLHPAILQNNPTLSAAEGRTTGPEIPNFSGTYSVRDNVIRIEFVRSDNPAERTLIENSNNEISRAMAAFASGRTIKVNGSSKTFEPTAYIDAECTTTTDLKGDLAAFYIKASDITWNLSATGTDAGSDVDSHGNHQTNKIDLTIERAFQEAFYTLTDHHKNRINNYKDASRFTATASRCATNDMFISFAIADFTSNAIYLFFDQPVAFNDETWNDDSQSDRTKTAIKIISAIGNTTAVRTVDSVERLPATQYGLKLTLNESLTYEMITHGILIQYGGSFLLENKIHSTHQVAKVVRDGETHCISDVITNCVEVQYAYDNRNDTYISSTGGLAQEDSIAMRNFSGEGRNNKVFSNQDITLVTKDISSANFKYKLIADITPTPGSNGNLFNQYSGNRTRFWFPTYSNGSSNFTFPISGFAETRNFSTNIITSDSPEIDYSPITGTTTIKYLFHNFSENTPCLGWQPASNVNFFFEVTKSDGTSYEINHKYQSGSQEITPLYCARLKDPLDPTSIDLWSFIISEPNRQRGGVSIYSNVINAANKEFCTLEVNMPKTGNLRVIIMTADGNVVKYLENGRQAEGLHYYYWNGTNNAGDTVARGIYFIRIVGPDIEETRKVMVVK